MTLREERHPTTLLHPDLEGAAPRGEPASPALVLSGVSAISGAVVGFLLAGSFYASFGLLIAALLSSWIGWWARGLHEGP